MILSGLSLWEKGSPLHKSTAQVRTQGRIRHADCRHRKLADFLCTGGIIQGQKNWLFAGSDSGGEPAAVLYSLIGTCRLNNVEPEKWLRYVIEHIQDWPANRVRDLLP